MSMYDIRLLCIVVKGSYTFYFHRKPTAEKGLYSFAHWLQMNHVSKQLWEKMKGKSIKGRMCLKSVGMIDTNITSYSMWQGLLKHFYLGPHLLNCFCWPPTSQHGWQTNWSKYWKIIFAEKKYRLYYIGRTFTKTKWNLVLKCSVHF